MNKPHINFPTSDTALVLEGGGMRTVFTVGVLDCFLDHNVHFPYMVCVSGGASNGVSYKSRQRGRSHHANITLFQQYKYIGIKPLLKMGRFIDLDYLFEEYVHDVYPFDFNQFFASSTRFEAVVTDCLTGEARYLSESSDPKRLMKLVKASASLPVISPTVFLDGMELSDGGMSDSIPLARAFSQGYNKAVVVLSQNKGFRKKPSRCRIPTWLTGYKAMSNLLHTRPERYNEQLAWVEQLEEQGSITVLRPEKPLKVRRLTTDAEQLQELYEEGYNIALKWINDYKKQ